MKIKNVDARQVLRLFGFEYEVERKEMETELNKKLAKGGKDYGEEKSK